MKMTELHDVVMPEVDFGTDLVPDLAERLVKLQEEGKKLVPVRYFGQKAWVVLGHEHVTNVMSDDQRLPAAAQWARDWDSGGKTLLHMRGEEHRKYKTLLSPLFSPSAVRKLLEQVLVPTADELIDEFGSARELELNEGYCRRYGFNVISRVLGFPVPRKNELELRDLVISLVQQREQSTLPPENRRMRSYQAVAEMNRLLKPVIDARRENPQDNLISRLLTMKIDGEPLDDETLYTFVRLIYLAGADTTGLTLGNVMSTILSMPGLKETLIEHPEVRESTIDEAIRLYAVTGLVARYTEREVVIDGTTIPPHTYILFGIPAANRDRSRFNNPSDFLIDRKRNLNEQLTFGVGTHFCLGKHLAREEIKTSVSRLLDRLPGLRLADSPDPIGGCLFRYVPELRVRFDDILPVRAS